MSLDSAVLGFSVNDFQGNFLEANSALSAMLGYSREELLTTLNWFELSPPEYRHIDAKALVAIKQQVAGESYERQIIQKDGTRIEVLITCELATDGDNRFICYYTDLSGIRNSKNGNGLQGQDSGMPVEKIPFRYADFSIEELTIKAVQESEERFRSMADSSPVIIYVSDNQGICYANKTCLDFYGTTMDDLRLNGWRNYVHPQDLEPFFMYCADAATRLEIFETEVRARRHDGEWRWLLVSGAPRMLDEGTLAGYTGISIDITERKQAEALLKESEEKYRAVVEGTNEGIWYWDLKKDELYWSPRLYELLGLDAQPFAPSLAAFLETVHPEDRADIAEKLEAHRQGMAALDIEFRVIKPCGGIAYLHNRSKVYCNSDGHPVRIGGMAADITYRKQTEQALLAYKNQLEKSNRELEHFATIASHELQEPLRKVRLFSEMIATNVLPDATDYLERMQNAVSRMQTLVTDLLALSRINRKGKPFRDIDLSEVLTNSLNDLDMWIQDHQATVNGRLQGRIHADQNQIEQLMQNLIHNAIKFHEPEKAPVVAITGDALQDGWYQIQITDDGIGFDPEYTDRIFEPFERLHGRQQYPGTGMGLAICKRIVERHNGHMVATSTPGVGSCFTVTLPVARRAESGQWLP